MFSFVITLACMAVAAADHPAPAYGAPRFVAAPVYHAAAPHHVHHEEAPHPYAFEYGVDDNVSGSHFSQKANNNGHGESGSYSVCKVSKSF